jgi:hypothetical protein
MAERVLRLLDDHRSWFCQRGRETHMESINHFINTGEGVGYDPFCIHTERYWSPLYDAQCEFCTELKGIANKRNNILIPETLGDDRIFALAYLPDSPAYRRATALALLIQDGYSGGDMAGIIHGLTRCGGNLTVLRVPFTHTGWDKVIAANARAVETMWQQTRHLQRTLGFAHPEAFRENSAGGDEAGRFGWRNLQYAYLLSTRTPEPFTSNRVTYSAFKDGLAYEPYTAYIGLLAAARHAGPAITQGPAWEEAFGAQGARVARRLAASRHWDHYAFEAILRGVTIKQ